MKNKELQDLLRQYPDDIKIRINHPEGDWRMTPIEAKKYDDDEHLFISTDFSEDDE